MLALTNSLGEAEVNEVAIRWLYKTKPEDHWMKHGQATRKNRQAAPNQRHLDQWWGNIARIPPYMDLPTALLLVSKQSMIKANQTDNATSVTDKAKHRLERLFWILVIASGFFCASLLLWDAIEDWVENPTGTISSRIACVVIKNMYSIEPLLDKRAMAL